MLHNQTWRLIFTPPAPGAWNMALDEAILEAVTSASSPPTMRLYAWNPPCLSLGYAQPISDINLPSMEALGWQIVRRPTGGRALLHTDELTYSIIAPQNNPLVSGTILESYRRLSNALLCALNILGLSANADKEYPLPAGSQPNPAVCFEVPSNYEITVNGKKLIGSAQARRFKGVLQHGSLPLSGDLTRITWALNFPFPQERDLAARRLLDHAATVEMLLGRTPTWDEAAAAFQAAFPQTFGIELIQGSPTLTELMRTTELVREKYANIDWNNRI